MYTISDIRLVLQHLEQMLAEMENSAVLGEYELQIRTGFTSREMEALLEREGAGGYERKIAELERKQQWTLVEELCKLASKVQRDHPEKESAGHIAFRIENMLEVLSLADANGALAEKAFRVINQNKELLRVLSEVRVEPYLKQCMRYCNRISTAALVEL